MMGSQSQIICLTCDIDPDGLSAHIANRSSMTFSGLEYIISQWHNVLQQHDLSMPMTWFVRADAQIEDCFGECTYLFKRYSKFWETRIISGDEIGWHPHVYQKKAGEYLINKDTEYVVGSMRKVWEYLQLFDYPLNSFRMGEGWHTPATYGYVEKLGFRADSTAIPRRVDAVRDWQNTPTHPYHPSVDDIRQPSNNTSRGMLEIPMSTWEYAAPYDAQPRLRYINPAIHPQLWRQAVDRLIVPADILSVWVLIVHPDELAPFTGVDLLYAKDIHKCMQNIIYLVSHLENSGNDIKFMTINDAAEVWLAHEKRH